MLRAWQRSVQCAVPRAHARCLSIAAPAVNGERASTVTPQDRQAVRALAQRLQNARSTNQLLAMYKVMATGRPFHLDGSRVVECKNTAAQTKDAPYRMQMLTLQAFVQRVRDGRTAFPSAHWAVDTTNSSPSSRTVLLSEAMIQQCMLEKLVEQGDHAKVRELYEEYAFKREELVLQAHSLDTDSAVVADATALGYGAHSAYVKALSSTHADEKLIDFFHCAENFERYLGSPPAVQAVLLACTRQQQGDLARRVIEEIPRLNALLMMSVMNYEMALQANLKGPSRTHARLDNALAIYKRMVDDDGYLLRPTAWSMLLNTCIYLGRTEDAVFVFGSYGKHRIAPFQPRFVQGLRTACKFERHEMVVQMVDAWVKEEKQREATGAARYPGERECYNKVLWELVKGVPQLQHLDQVLESMQERGIRAGAIVIRRLIARYLSDTQCDVNSSRTAHQVVHNLLLVWERVPLAMAHNAFVLHLILEECLGRQWFDQIDGIIQYAITKNIELPVRTMTKILEVYELGGHFQRGIELGERLILEADAGDQKALEEPFYAALLKCHSHVGNYHQILAMNDELKLVERYPELASVVQAARDSC